jgi:hypothetical protein
MHVGVWWESQIKRDHEIHIGMDEREYIIKKELSENCGGVVVWIRVEQDRDHWWALVNSVMNFQIA